MKITGLEIDGYGVWSGLKLEGLSEGLNVLYGPNEAGKTTLLQFVRAMLYGFSPQRQRYLPPLRGGRPGGSLQVAGPNGQFQIARHQDPAGDSGGGEEQLALTAADGTRQGEHLLKILLSQIDEATYNNVFAVGLREMQELGTLSDIDAASLLYNLTAGLDRVSLVEVMRELDASRNRVLDRQGGPCLVAQLLAQRTRLCQDLEELRGATRRYARLAAQRDQVDRDVARLEEETRRAQEQAAVMELAISLRERWAERAALEDQLAALGPHRAMPEGAVERLDAVKERLQSHRQRVAAIDTQRRELRAEAAALTVNEVLWRQSARIEAIGEQEPWLTNLQNQVGELDAEIAQLRATLAGEQQRLGLPPPSEEQVPPALSQRLLKKLRAPAKALRAARGRLRQAREATAAAEEAGRGLTEQIETALAARQERELAGAMDRVGNLVAQLRRRIQIDERLDQMSRYKVDMEEQSRDLLERHMLPLAALLGLGGVFALGVMLVLASLFLPGSVTGSLGWALAVLGLGGSAAAAVVKILLERSNARQMETCQRQISLLQTQIEQIQQEREALDGQLPRGGGPIASRLATAEKDLAALEDLVPLETRRAAARQEAEAAARRASQAQEEFAANRRRWRTALDAAGLPPGLSPQQVRRLTERSGELVQVQRRLEHRCEELQQRRRELESLAGRIVQLAVDSGVALQSQQPLEQIRQLAAALAQQQAAVARRETLRRQARQLHRKRAKHEAVVGRLKHRRHRLLLESGAESEEDFRQRAVRAARAAAVEQQRQALSREIATAIAGHCPEDTIGRQLQGVSASQLDARLTQLRDQLAARQTQLKQQCEARGHIAEQLKILAADRQLGGKQLELATVEKRLKEAVHRWQVLAVTSRILDDLRATYQRDRQPATLQEASGYLTRLTQGRYLRVWTPLGEQALCVDDAEGHALPIEALSRGTREQLFFSLRLALAAHYARHGAPLPLVLDDVLVNFDALRAKTAAAVLRDFAAAGHQLLVFTCHEHILKLFKSLKVAVAQLPDNTEAQPRPINLRTSTPAQPKRGRKAGATPRRTAAKANNLSAEEEVPESTDEDLPEKSGDAEQDEADSVPLSRRSTAARKGKATRSRRARTADDEAGDEENRNSRRGAEDDSDDDEDYRSEVEDDYSWEDDDADTSDYEDDDSADAA